MKSAKKKEAPQHLRPILDPLVPMKIHLEDETHGAIIQKQDLQQYRSVVKNQ
jgi:hypothetical protein